MGLVMRVAAIIPLYNGARYIGQALESILNQTRPADEIIVVDDGSTDDGPAVVAGMAETHPIRLLHKQNGGQSSARNFGVAHSSSDFIALLDQDDRWYPGHLAELVKPFLVPRTGAPLGWTYSNLDEIDADGHMLNHGLLSKVPSQHPKRSLADCLRHDLFILPSASLISRRAFDEVGGFDERLSGYEDDDLFLRLFLAGYDNEYIDARLSQWRMYPESCSYSDRMHRSRLIYYSKLVDAFPDNKVANLYYSRDLITPRFRYLVLYECLRAARTGNVKELRARLQELWTFKKHLRWSTRLGLIFGWPLLTSPQGFLASVRLARSAKIRFN